MEQQVLDLLASTLDPSGPIRKGAESQLDALNTNDAFPVSLISIASHKSVPIEHRQAALLNLKTLVLKRWSPGLEEFEGPPIEDGVQEQVRQGALAIATAPGEERKIVAAAAYVVSKIASADFPERWPTLLPTLLNQAPQADATQLYGILIVLSNLVEDGFDEEQFARSAVDLVNCLYNVAVDGQKKLMTRALAVSIFRACFDTMELVYQTNPESVQQFMQQASDAWTPFFLEVVKMPLPSVPREDETNGVRSEWQGVIALKTQVVKALDKISTMFPQLLASRMLDLFAALWGALESHLAPYHALYTGEETTQARLEDSDRLPFSLDFLVIEEVDYIHTLLGNHVIKYEIGQQINQQNGSQNTTWITQILAVAAGFSHIPTEDAEMWELDVNCFLSEETSETANYTARNACSYLAQKLADSKWAVAENMLVFSRSTFENASSSAKSKEAALYIMKQIIDEIELSDKTISLEISQPYLELVRLAIQDNADDFLRARGFILASTIVASPFNGDSYQALIPEFAQLSLKAIEHDSSEMVKVSCIRAMQRYLKNLKPGMARDYQVATVSALGAFVSSQDMSEFADGEDLLDTIVETLREAIDVDPAFALEHPALDLLFTMATYGARSWNTTMIVGEAFEAITMTMARKGPQEYAKLCAKVLPSLTAAIDVGDMTQESSLSDVAVSLIATLAEHGSQPLPQGFVAAVLPKLNRLLYMELDFSVHQSATLAIKHALSHDSEQVFAYRDPENGKEGIEVILLIIDRLLSPSVEDSSAAEVGGLAAELVYWAGSTRLGPYLEQLLRVVAIRLETAERANFIQSLVLVFARLSEPSQSTAKEVLDFLSMVQVNNSTGLEVVLKKWLDNSVTFSGYEAIRQNVLALINIFNLHDERLANIRTKGDLVVDNTSRIKTRSQAKKVPDQYTMIPVPLKLTKVLVQELSTNTSPTKSSFGLLSNGRKASIVSDNDDEEWEDDGPGVLDLGSPTTRQDLMGLADDKWDLNHETDDETQRILVQFFNSVAEDTYFLSMYPALNDSEKMKLQVMNSAVA